jgi:hypothetical protein
LNAPVVACVVASPDCPAIGTGKNPLAFIPPAVTVILSTLPAVVLAPTVTSATI